MAKNLIHFYQNSFLNEHTEKIKKREVFYGKFIDNKNQQRDGGLKLDQFASLLNHYGLMTQVFHVDTLTELNAWKSVLVDSLKDQESFIVINFDRKLVGQNGGGHISPLVAYDSPTDSFLVLDVNPTASEWFWVSSDALFRAMNTLDDNAYRGFVRVSKSQFEKPGVK